MVSIPETIPQYSAGAVSLHAHLPGGGAVGTVGRVGIAWSRTASDVRPTASASSVSLARNPDGDQSEVGPYQVSLFGTGSNFQRNANPCFSLERAVSRTAPARSYEAVATGGCHGALAGVVCYSSRPKPSPRQR
jgi:hypothetical protein